MSFNGGLDLSMSSGKVPLALLKSVNFIENLTKNCIPDYNLAFNDNSQISEFNTFVL